MSKLSGKCMSIARAHASRNLSYEYATKLIISDFDTADEAVEEEVPVVVSEGEVDSHLIPAEIVKQETSSDIEQGEIHYNQVNKVSLHCQV